MKGSDLFGFVRDSNSLFEWNSTLTHCEAPVITILKLTYRLDQHPGFYLTEKVGRREDEKW